MADGSDRFEVRADQRRRQILDAAEACFRARGFHAATMAEIAAEAGLSVGQIYRFFENKEAVVEAITDQQLKEFFATVSLADSPASARSTIRRLIADSLEKLCRPGCAALMLEVTAEASRNPRVSLMVQKRDAQIRSVLRDLLAKAELQIVDTNELDARAEMFCLWFEGTAARLIRHPEVDRGCLDWLQARMTGLLLGSGA